MVPEPGQCRAVIEGVYPELDGGLYAIKRVVGDEVTVRADVFADGHDAIAVELLYRATADSAWQRAPMEAIGNDRWEGCFTVETTGDYFYTIQAWVDHYRSWHRDLHKRVAANQDVAIDLLIGADLVAGAAGRATGVDAKLLRDMSSRLRDDATPQAERAATAFDEHLHALALLYPDRTHATTYHKELRVYVDRTRAGFSTWYELFPRSTSLIPGQHGTFNDVIKQLPRIAAMGFDIVYLPPIHPIGTTFRKGKNNAVVAQPGDVGSPWAIGNTAGGHTAIHPDLGSLKKFRELVLAAHDHGMEIALDIAFQCSPDHPWVKEHPNWFKQRPDGTIQYAENPPKKYQDIYPINFETDDWENLWDALRGVMLYWAAEGVRVFRVDNPHTKSFAFWEWAIRTIKEQYPDVIFLSEAFTRPKVMYLLAKLGFTQSYTYFTWRNSKDELTEYLTELTTTVAREFFRPNFWPNTPDILHAYLQHGGKPAFVTRLVLAATLTANYGMYGPAFEMLERIPREPGSEEYLNSEKYQLRQWDMQAENIRDLITRVNHIRRENPALHNNWNLLFHPTDNDQIICYSKHTPDMRNRIVVVANLNPYTTQAGWVGIDTTALNIDMSRPFIVHDLLTGDEYTWTPYTWNYVELNPNRSQAHILRV